MALLELLAGHLAADEAGEKEDGILGARGVPSTGAVPSAGPMISILILSRFAGIEFP